MLAKVCEVKEVNTVMLEKPTTIATHVGAGAALFFGLTANEFAALAGVALALISLIINLVFKIKHLRIAQEKHSGAKVCAEDCPLRSKCFPDGAPK